MAKSLRRLTRVGNGLINLDYKQSNESCWYCLISLNSRPPTSAQWCIGAVAVPTSTSGAVKRITAYFLEESRARIAIVHSTLLAELGPALAGQRYCTNAIVCGDPADGYIQWKQFLKDGSPNLDAAPTNKDDAAFWR